MARQYVHLSAEPQTATIVGQRKDPNPIILKIDAKRAFENGVKFYFGNETTWLSDFVPPEYISG
jgi:putative RNA 2'-phosphotransferase